MEFLDEDTRPRFLFQSRAIPSSRTEHQTTNFRKPSVLISLCLSSLLFAVSLFFIKSEPFQSLLFWFALSILVGPFAPTSLTGGDIRVGLGRVLEPLPQNDEIDRADSKKKIPNRRSRARKIEELGIDSAPPIVHQWGKAEDRRDSPLHDDKIGTKSVINGGESDWTESDFELLKKQLAKHPVGKSKRWEVIAEAFQGRHAMESVVKVGKSMGDKKTNDADSYTKFLKDRKPVDRRIEAAADGVNGGGDGVTENGEVKREDAGVSWSSGDDIALLNALKAFPKDVSMRWDKIAAAVPGKTKAACMKRVAELKKDFRSSKNSDEAQ